MPQLPITSTDIKKLLREKCPPTTDADRVYTSILVALSENIETINAQTDELIKAAKFLGSLLGQMQKPEENTEQESATNTANVPQDKTPFPQGVKAQVPTNPASLNDAENVPQPNVGSSGAMNAAPIPKPPTVKGPTPNGKDSSV